VFPLKTSETADIKSEFIEEPEGVSHYGSFNFLKAGISFADMVNTVSPTYANELLTPELGFGMENILENRGLDFSGILNGVDYNEWDPATDTLLPHNYSSEDLSGKSKNKQALLEQFNLPIQENTPLIGIVSRMAGQKGFDLIARTLEYLSKLPVQWVILGSGEDVYEDMFKSFAEMRPEKAACYIGYNNELAHLIEAGADMFLMPSKYEPCGLNQIYSLKYGTVPIVRKTGGLADTVMDYDEYLQMGKKTGNGFSFKEYNGFGLTDSVERAIKYYHKKEVWNTIIMNGMNEDFSWAKSAEKYVEMYKKAIKKK
jgi:starch synthase